MPAKKLEILILVLVLILGGVIYGALRKYNSNPMVAISIASLFLIAGKLFATVICKKVRIHGDSAGDELR